MSEAFALNKNSYLSGNSWFCPYCKSSRIIMGDLQDDHHLVWRTVDCVDCGKDWNEIYTMTDIEERLWQ